MIKKFLKNNMPGLYDYYLHIKRLLKIRQINKIKDKPFEDYPAILGEIYSDKIGHELDWNNLQTYTEKMQWEKLYGKNPMKEILSDKYRVRAWIESKIGSEYLIPLLGAWDSFDEIDFSLLPEKFVIKTNHGSGTNVIVKDKSKFNIKRAKRCFDDWMRMDYAYVTWFEMHYSDIPRKIIAEQYLESDMGELQDYKFLCFNGKPEFCWVDLGRYSKHTRTVFDMEWNLQPWTQNEYGISPNPIPCPKNFDKMIEIATVLSAGFEHVRVDLYNINGKIYFGEMTFTNGSGLDKIIPEKYDKILGDFWTINKS